MFKVVIRGTYFLNSSTVVKETCSLMPNIKVSSSLGSYYNFYKRKLLMKEALNQCIKIINYFDG